jgi:hypothetical protein
MKAFICFIIVALAGLNVGAQTESPAKAADTSTAAADAETPNPKSTLTVGAVYCANADYYGQAALKKLPYIAAVATYRHKSGFYLTALAYRLFSDTARHIASAENLSAGVDFKISKKLAADLSYSHSFYPAYSPFLQAGNPDNASVTLNYDTWIKPSISADYAFGKTPDMFVTAGLSKAITLGSINEKDVVVITPAFNVTGGTQKFYQTYITQQKLADSVAGVIFTPIFGEAPGSSFQKTITTFNILSYNLKMPVDYNRSNYVLEASCQFSMLSNHTVAGPGKLNSFVSFSFYYQF